MLGADALTDKNLFLQGAFQDLGIDGSSDSPEGVRSPPKLLSCDAVEERKILNSTCVLSPIVTEGPYYHIHGHPIRQNMAEWQLGFPFVSLACTAYICYGAYGAICSSWTLELSMWRPANLYQMSSSTCGMLMLLATTLVRLCSRSDALGLANLDSVGHGDPAPHLINELPQVGGKRSGLLSAFPRGNDDETFLRAAWPTDKNGVSQFTSIFPGYYTGRYACLLFMLS